MTLGLVMGLQRLQRLPTATAVPPADDLDLLRFTRKGDFILDGDLVLKSLKGLRFRIVVSDCGTLSTYPFSPLAPARRLDVKPTT